jgi:acetyltransferase-like isoleucine patch superfamily enzyme
MGELTTGKYTYGLPLTRRGTGNTVNIGAFCSFASGVTLDGGFQHNMKFLSTFPFPSNFPDSSQYSGHVVCKGDINIGNDVWIGESAMIMSGVTIGDGAVIGFRSIISKDVEPYSIVAGAPQKVLRYRFDQSTIEKLLEIKWWEWPDENIKVAVKFLMSEDIDSLYKYFKNNVSK